jgi:Zn-dependent peptidase ImmA (M78 family)/DNA-binding XRE family transcriptional regulator
MMTEFNRERLTIARRRRRQSSKGLAELVGVTPVTLSRWENGATTPEDEAIDRLAEALDFPVAFFLGDACAGPDVNGASFRSLTAMSAKERDAALAAGSLAYLLSDWVDERFDLPSANLVDLSFEEDPEAAAAAVRQAWGLGMAPITDMVRLLEAHGVRVFSLAENTKNVDAFSCWRDDVPFVFLNTFKSTEHSRFDAAHELGHLVLHKHGGPHAGREAEVEANRFASALLMPAQDVLGRIRRVTGLADLVQAKKRWGVSVAALAYRLHKLSIVSDWQYRGLCIEMNQVGYRTAEPEGLKPERSEVWRKIFSELWADRLTRDDVAKELSLPSAELDNLLFGLNGQPVAVPKGTTLTIVEK